MPSPGSDSQLGNTGLRGTKQSRRRLALTLPGVDCLGSTSHPFAESCSSENKLLKLSMENKSTMTTNSILTTDLDLSLKLSLTSSPGLSLTSPSYLTNKFSSSISPSGLLNSSLTSTNYLMSSKASDLDSAFSALTSSVPLSSKCPVTSSLLSGGAVDFTPLSTENKTLNSLPPKPSTTFCPVLADQVGDHKGYINRVEFSNHTVTSLSSAPSGVTLSLHPFSTAAKTEPSLMPSDSCLFSRDTVAHSFLPPSLTSNLQSTLGVEHTQSKEYESGEDEMPDDKSSEEESVSSDLTSSDVELFHESEPTPSGDGEPHARENDQTMEEESDDLSIKKPDHFLKQKKMALISAVCCSLVNSPNFSDPSDLTRADIQTLCEDIATLDPEFILKVALYTRQELNIRSTANFLLALSALLPSCRPHLRRYLCPSVQLPSDWMDVPRLYQSLAGNGDKLAPLPSSLRRALTLRFQQFSEYQLAKYNTRVQRGKREPKKKREKTKVLKAFKVARNLRSIEPSLKQLQKQLYQGDTASTDKKKKKKDKFSLKSLIQRLHISRPAHHVLSLLGCRYPKDLPSYSQSGLEGPWQSHLSGQRMKLKQPETWERELSQKGNTCHVWETLLDNHKVPFMASLRNLRNMIKAGISTKHHAAVNARLTNQHAVIQSRLFPFRFLSAYKVIQDLELQLQNSGEPFPSNADLLRRIFRREGKNIPGLARKNFNRSQLRGLLAVPFIHQLLKREKEAVKRARVITFDDDVLQSYKKSLEEAVQISARYNIPPIPGRTVILLYVCGSMHSSCHGAKELAVSVSVDLWRRKQPPSLLDVGGLLSLMVKQTAESAELVLYGDNDYAVVEHSTSPLLQRMEEIKDQASKLSDWSPLPFGKCNPAAEYLLELLLKRTKVDTFLVFTDSPNEEFQSMLKKYRQAVNPESLCVTVLPHGFKSEESIDQCKDVTLCGFTEQVLKYVSERGTDRLLDHVEKVNERFKVPEDPDKVKSNQTSDSLLTPFPKQRWRSVRVFISSTFRDMHSERDLLIGQVMPQLRLRAASHFLSLEEVDLRWGITEEETKNDRQLSLCLSEVVRSQIFIGILGERYGHTPKTYSVPHLPEYEWVHTYPAGRSITELEAMQFLHCGNQKHRRPKAFFYFRNPDVLGSVPSHWIPDFAAESQEAAKRVKDLKNRVSKHPAARNYSYSCQWGGEHDGKPNMTELEDFAAKVLEDLWGVIERDFIKESNASEDEDQLAQEAFQEWHEQCSFARSKLVTNTCAQILEKRSSSSTNGRLFLVVGEPSQGKTVFMADLVKELSIRASSVIYHFTEATTRAKEAETMLSNFCKQLYQRLQRRKCNLTSYRALLSEFQALLLCVSRTLKRSDTLTLLIDGADVLCGHAGELTSDWIPDFLPQRVNLVVSVTEGSSLCSSLTKRKDTVLITLGRLEPSERAELVRGKLALYGKKLEESAFNNQLRLLMIKKGTRDPLYLTMACEELRTSAVFEKLSEDIQKLPATLPPLIQKRLEMLEEEHGMSTVSIALTAICISRKGLLERDLLRILSSLQEIRSVYTACWDEILTAAIHANNLPMATFSLLLTGLKSVLGLWSRNMSSEPRLHVASSLLREAVEKRYFGKPEVVHAVHLLIAAHFWAVSSPEDPESSPALHAECLSELSYHLLSGVQFHIMGNLLTHIPFLKAHATLGLLPHLCQVYSSYASVSRK